MSKVKCTLCFTRVDKKSDIRIIGQPHFLNSFKLYSGLHCNNYKKTDIICKKCHVKVRKIVRHKSVDGRWMFSACNNNDENIDIVEHESVGDNDENIDIVEDESVGDNDENIDIVEDESVGDNDENIDIVEDESVGDNQEFHQQQETVVEDFVDVEMQSDNSDQYEEEDEDELLPEMPSTSHQLSTSQHLFLPNINCVKATQKCCFICKSTEERKIIPKQAIKQIWEEKNIYIPLENRTCSNHLQGNKFKNEAILQIEAEKSDLTITSKELSTFLLQVFGTPDVQKRGKKVRYEFSDPDDVLAEDYPYLLGITKENFDDLFTYVEPCLHKSVNRSKKNALAMFLMMLKQNISQAVLAVHFGIVDQGRVSDTIAAVLNALCSNFVPKFLGCSHLSRDKALKDHSRRIFNIIYEDPEDDVLFLVMDGTYLYIDKPIDFALQKKTYSTQKLRNLVKPFMIILPSGYVLDAPGPFYGDGKNNDAGILNALMRPEGELIKYVDTKKDHFVLDRGFRDSISSLNRMGIKTHMPSLLKDGKTQFSTSEGNESRKVTLNRWLVEAVNGRLKNKFKFFADVIHGTYLPKLTKFFRVTMAIINAYCPPLLENTERNVNFALKALARADEPNLVQTEVREKGLDRNTHDWLKVPATVVQEFPRLDLEDLGLLTLGVYQIGLAREYVKLHENNDPEFIVYVNEKYPNYLRAKMKSRFASNKTHNVWIKYDNSKVGIDSIIGYFCQCKQGARTVGCCSHVTAIIWYFGYYRHITPTGRTRRARTIDFLDAPSYLVNASDDSDENSDDE